MNSLYSTYQNLPVQARASVWFLICSFLQKGISVLSTPVFTRLLTTNEYGQFSVFISWMDIVSIFVTMNLFYGVYSQGIVKFEEEKKLFSSSMQGLVFTLCCVWCLLYYITKSFWNSFFSFNTCQMLEMFVLIWTTAVFNFWSVEKRTEYSYKQLVGLTLLMSILKPVLGIIFVTHFEDKVTARITSILIVQLVLYTGLFFSQLIRGKSFFSKKYWSYALGFSIPLVPHYLSQTVLNGADRIMIERMVDFSSAGIYSLAYSVSLIMTLFNTALLQTINPWIYKRIKSKEFGVISSIGLPALILIAFLNILLIAFAPEAIFFFAPKEYYEAIWIIPPVAMSAFFMFAYNLFADFEFYYEKTQFITLATIIGALINIVLNYMFIPMFGYIAAGYTTLLCYVIYALFHYLSMKYILKFDENDIVVFDEKKLLYITFSFLGIGFLFLFTYTNIIFRLTLIGICIVICIYIRDKILLYFDRIIFIKREK